MKILIENYSNYLSTEPQYLAQCINQTTSKAELWNTNQLSAFDAIDLASPDIVLCHHSCKVLTDVIKYLKDSNIELILNISGIKQNSLSIVEKIINKNNIKCKLLITNDHKEINPLKSENFKILNLLPSADIFIPKQQVPDWNIEAGLISLSNGLDKKQIDQYTEKYSTIHRIMIANTNETLTNLFDYSINIINGCSVYNKYKNIILHLSTKLAFSQLLFDIYLRANNVILETDDRNLTSQILNSLFENEDKNVSTTEKIKNQINKKHTCTHRTIKLLRSLECAEDIKILEKSWSNNV